MSSGKQLARRAPAAVASADGASDLRLRIREALDAYELAVATRLKAEQEAATASAQYLGVVAELERRASQERERDEQASQGVAAVEAARIEMLASLAAETERAAVSLLESSALAHVRGVGDVLAGSVQPHLATDEQAAAAFAAAQTAAVDLRAALFKLAAAHRENRDWESARGILIPLCGSTTGALHDTATALLYATYTEQAAVADAGSDWERAYLLIESAIELFPDRLQTDPALADQFLRTTRQLVEAAMARDRRDDAERHLATARRRLGPGHPGLRGWPAQQSLGWASGQGSCLQEFGGHSAPVEHVAFTADGEHLVSVDGSQLKRWRIPGANPGTLVATVIAPGAYQLTDGALLAITADGALLSTDDGTVASQIAGATAGGVTSFASARNGSAMAWTARESVTSRQVKLYGEEGFRPVGTHGYGEPSQSDSQLLVPFHNAYGINFPLRIPKDAVRAGLPVPARNATRYRPAAIRFVEAVCIGDSLTGQADSRIAVEPKALVLHLALSSSADFVAWLDPAGKVVITDIATRIVRHAFAIPSSQVPCGAIVISPQDRLVAIAQAQVLQGGMQSGVTAWDVTTGGQVCSWQLPGFVGGITISPDERLIAALDTVGNIAIYDLRAQSPLPAVGNHGPTVFPNIAFSPDGSRLVTSGDRTIKIWGVP
jgi:WD domain, G-beta repeat